jgi:hypothetical protein
MQAKVAKHPLLIVLLDAGNSRIRINDANRIKNWLESKLYSDKHKLPISPIEKYTISIINA